MPIYNWFRFAETGDLKFMIAKNQGKYNEADAQKAYKKVYSDYIDVFGISESFERVLELKKHLMQLRIDKAITGDNFINNYIRMAEIDLEQITKNTGKTNTNETKVHLEKYLGFRLNEKEISVKEYYTYLKVMSNDNRKAA